MWNAHVLARSKSCFTRDPMQPFNIATWTSISPLPSQLPTMPTRDHRTKRLGEQPSNSDRKDIMQSIRVSKRYWGGHPFLRVHYDGSWTGNDQIDSLHCKRKCKEQQQLKKKKKKGGKNAAGQIFSITGKGEVIIAETIKKKSFFFKKIFTKAKNKEEYSNNYWHLLSWRCQGLLRCHRIGVCALTLQVTDCMFSYTCQLKAKDLPSFLKHVALKSIR